MKLSRFFILIVFLFSACTYDDLFTLWRPHFNNAFYTISGVELRTAAKKDTIYLSAGKPVITAYYAVIQGEFTHVQDTIVQYGHCWSTVNPLPLINPNDTSTFSRYYKWNFDSLGTFTSRISLMPETPFWVRAYVITSSGDTGYLPVSYCDTTIPPINEWFVTNKMGVFGRMNAASFTFTDPGKNYECAFVVGGNDASTSYNDMWEFDPKTETWTQMAGHLPYPLTNLVGFGVTRRDQNGRLWYEIYAGTGENYDGTTKYDFFYRYSFVDGTWLPISPYPSTVSGAVAFVIDNRAFVGLGISQNNTDVGYFFEFRQDLVDSAGALVWRQVQAFGNNGDEYRRHNAVAFVINNRAFVGTGEKNENGQIIYYNDLWMFVPPEATSQGKWYRRSELPGSVRSCAVGLSIEDQGYIGLGFNGYELLKDFYRYDPFNDQWYPIADYKIGPQYTGQIQRTCGAVGFGIENKGYVGTGYQGDTASVRYTNEFWIYRPW